jgi:MFS family permease
MQTTVSAPIPRRTIIEAVIASTVGTTIEWYDFFVYGLAAALVFPELYFPESDPLTAQVLSFGTFTVGFVARPIGGVVFGYMGDRAGRKAALVSTLLLMGFSTLAVGFLPTYRQIGPAAPVLLTILRFLQGLGVGGEWGGAVLLALEYGHRGRRGFLASWPQVGVPLGLVAAAGVLAACEGSLSPADLKSWGWRVPFFLSGLLIAVGLLIRLRILETPLFAALKEREAVAEAPLRETLRLHWREVLLVAGTRIVENATFYLISVSMLVYGPDVLGIEKNVMLRAVVLAALAEMLLMPLYGHLSDRWSRRGVYMAGCWFLILFAFPFYALLDTRDPLCINLALILALCGGHAVLYSVQASLIPELFGTRVRCTAASVGYQLAAPLGGGLAPHVNLLLISAFPGHYWPLAAFIIVMAVISMACVYRLAETSRKDISG